MKWFLSILILSFNIIYINAQVTYIVNKVWNEANWSTCYVSVGSKIKFDKTSRNYKEVSTVDIGSCKYVVKNSERIWNDAFGCYVSSLGLSKYSDFNNKTCGAITIYNIDDLDPYNTKIGIALINSYNESEIIVVFNY